MQAGDGHDPANPRFYWEAESEGNYIKATLYREVRKHGPRNDSWLAGERIDSCNFSVKPGDPDVKERIQKWATAKKHDWLTNNATGLVLTRLKGKNYV